MSLICLSFDTDHMSEQRMREFFARVELPGRGTFFCTQVYDCLQGSEMEIAPHPFLEPGGVWVDELSRMRTLFPDAVGWRSHSCVFSHILAEWIGKNGYLYASTNDQFGQAGISPIQQPWGVWHMPIYYMDNMDFSQRRFWPNAVAPFSASYIERALHEDGLYVFDFHPIHLLLNTPHPEYYFSVRDRFRSGAPITDLRYEGNGTGVFFDALCAEMAARNVRSVTMTEALELFLKSDPKS